MKKVFAMLLVVLMALGMFACKKPEVEESKAPTFEEIVAGIEGCMTHAQYVAAAKDDAVKVLMYVQATQSWWDGKIVVYGQAPDGAYLVYNMTCTEEDAAKLVPGTAILVEGYKTEYSALVEIAAGATFTFYPEAGTWTATAVDVTAIYGTADIDAHMNEKISIKGAVVTAKGDNGDAFFYKWNGAGKAGDNADLYFDITLDGKVYTVTVESYLCGQDTEVYKTVEAFKVGDVVDLEGFLYWYNGAQPHITSIIKK